MCNAKLTISRPGRAEQEVKLDGRMAIGRASDNAICIEDSSISRYHALIERRGDGFWLSDLGSVNGTAVNDMPVTSEHKLDEADRITVGGVSTIVVHLTEARPPAQAAAPRPSAEAEAAAPATSGGGDEPTPQAARKGPGSGLSPLVIIAAVAAGLAVTVAAALLLIPSGSEAGRGRAQAASPRDDAAVRKQGSPQAETRPEADDKSGAGDAEDKPPPAPDEPRKADGGSVMPGDPNVALLSQNLAGLIVRKSGNGYFFDPAFAARIRSHTDEYRIDMSGYVRNYRFQINKAFSTNPLPPTVGYILAMSRSRFKSDANDPRGVGLWCVPREIALTYKAPEEPDMVLDDAGRSAEIAAQYLKSLIDIFGPDDFMYAIACFGMPTARAGDIKKELDQRADPAARRDFWSMVKLGVVPADGADRVARFFAAGIVAENPQLFKVGGQSLSWLVTN